MPKKKYYAQIYVEYELNSETPVKESEDFAKDLSTMVWNQFGVTDAYLNDWGLQGGECCPTCGEVK